MYGIDREGKGAFKKRGEYSRMYVGCELEGFTEVVFATSFHATVGV